MFAWFGFGGVRTSAEFGVGLALTVLPDAFLLRMTIIPAVMHLIGRRNWAIPTRLERALPHMSVEGPADTAVVAGDLATQPAPALAAVDSFPSARRMLELLEERGWTGWTMIERTDPSRPSTERAEALE